MDEFHLPKIVKLREQSGGCLGKSVTACEGKGSTAGRRQKGCREKRCEDGTKSARKKRTSANERQRKTCCKKAASLGKSSRHEGKTQNNRKRYETIGLPKITTNTEESTLKVFDGFGVKKPRRTKANNGDTITCVYSKSLQDENTMAFLRNGMEFEKDFNLNNEIREKRSSFDKKPYGLPALKPSEELNEKERLLREDSDGSLTETESLLNAWEVIDDEVSNGTTYDSTDCSTGNDG